MKTSLALFPRRTRLAALCLAWAAWAAGCGPGVGGTGTGETADALRLFGATATALIAVLVATLFTQYRLRWKATR